MNKITESTEYNTTIIRIIRLRREEKRTRENC